MHLLSLHTIYYVNLISYEYTKGIGTKRKFHFVTRTMIIRFNTSSRRSDKKRFIQGQIVFTTNESL